jgi:Domain of unknown function (DUF6321)
MSPDPEIESPGEGCREEGRSSLSQLGGQYECREETASRRSQGKNGVSETIEEVMTAPTKDPKGGLTAAGRREFARKEGAQLKPGVKKPVNKMTPEEMKRKGSWAARFYGRKKLPALKDKNGKPTRFALTAAAWGEPVPKTEAAARKIAAKGRKLLERYQRLQAKSADSD